jgi:hypothetical protein
MAEKVFSAFYRRADLLVDSIALIFGDELFGLAVGSRQAFD